MNYLDLFSGLGGFHEGLRQTIQAFTQSRKSEQLDRGYQCSNLEGNEQNEQCSKSLQGWSRKSTHGEGIVFDPRSRNIRWLGNEQQTDDIGWCGHSEIDKYACSIYHRHFPESVCLGGIQTVDPTKLPGLDIVTFGFPCTDLSIAGKRKGLAAPRSGLFFEAMRIIRVARPKYFVFENVKGLFSSNRGKDWDVVLREIADSGYDGQWQLLNTRWFLPQNRERIYFVGHLRGERRPEVFPIGEECTRTAERSADSATVRAITGGGHSGGAHFGMTILNVNKRQGYYNETDCIGALATRDYKGPSRDVGTVVQCIDPNFKKDGLRLYDEHIPTLSSRDYKEPKLVHTAFKGEPREYADCSPTISTPSGGGHLPYVATPILTPDRIKKRQNGRRFKENNDPSFTLTGQDIHGVMITANAVTPDAYLARGERNRDENGKAVLTSMCDRRIRRLTPTECERLQGFDDGWTEGISDTQRYKSLGNAVSVPVVKAVMERLLPYICQTNPK